MKKLNLLGIKRKMLIICLCSFFVLKGYAQSGDCNCILNLDTVIAKTERNYAGFPVKVTAANKTQYTQLKQILRGKAAKSTAAKQCFNIIRDYVRYFYDSHFQFTYYNEKDFDKEIIQLNESDFRKSLNQKPAKPLEGIWMNEDSSLKLAIRAYPNDTYKAIVLESKKPAVEKGLVYMTFSKERRGLTVKYYNSFSAANYPIKQRGNLLQGWSDELFGKLYPTKMTEKEQREMKTWLNHNNGLDFYKLSSKTAVLKVPTFANNDDKIAKLILENDAAIRNTENLIVDLTGNSGGSTGWVSFLGYFMTNPIVQQSGQVRVSPENIKTKLADIEPFVVNPVPDEYKKYFPDSILSIYKKAYNELPSTKNQFYPVPGVIFPLDSITRFPRKIALVVDELCGSSTEYFFFLARESGKCISYGVNTFGMMDYEGAAGIELPFSSFRLSIPIVKSSWTDSKPIDKTGFRPTRLLDNIPPDQWLEYIRKEMER